MTSPTTHKGNIGQAAAVLSALNQGCLVNIPLEGAIYDLIVDSSCLWANTTILSLCLSS
jgi:hypothetical protein